LVLAVSAHGDPPSAPIALTAAIVDTTHVRLEWDTAAGAETYDVRRNGTTIGSSATNAFTDNAATAAAVQIYQVRAVGPGGTSAWSAAALAQTATFTDETLIPRLTPIRATHVLELRDAVNALRSSALLPPATFTDASLTSVRVKAVHVNELRSSLDGARSALGLASQSYAHAIAANTTPVRAIDLDELRTGVTGSAPGALFWNSVAAPAPAQSVACSANKIFAGAPGIVRRSSDGGATWQDSSGLPGGANVTAIVAAGGGFVFAQTSPDRMQRSSNDGATFTDIGATPETFTILLGAPHGLFAVGGVCASVWFSVDGTSWNARNSGISGCVTSLARSNRGRLYAGTAANGVFLSANDGASWSPVGAGIPSTNIHALAVDREQRVFAATHDQGIYRSTDDGDSWSAVNSGLTTSDIASLIIDSNGVLVAGSESGARTFTLKDAEGSWSVASHGLPSAGAVGTICSTHRHRFAAVDGSLFRASVEFRLRGLNFSPIVDGQNFDSQIDVSQSLQRMQLIRAEASAIRTFRLSKGQQHIPRIARTLGIRMAAGAKITSNLTENESELAALIEIGKAGDADVLVVGNEVLLVYPAMAATLISYIERVQEAVPGVPVTTVETFDRLLNNLPVIDAVDVVYANYYPFWSGVTIDDAIGFIDSKHQLIQAKASGKEVVVSEAGWPDAGNATATPANAALHLREFVAWARATNTDFLYFEAFDEQWKNEGGVGSHWGVRNRDGTLKSWPEPVLAGEWGGDEVIGGPGTPSIAFTVVPPYGDPTGTLRGTVNHLIPNDHRVAVYIRVGSLWYEKPFSDAPLTWIRNNGTWMADSVTHPNDANATEIAAYVLPAWYSPPHVFGLSSIPGAIAANAVASQQVPRSPP
jgi:exo-beta-1,3-glucanase (GH17 family)